MPNARMTDTTRMGLQWLGGFIALGGLWFLLSAAQSDDPYTAVGMLMQFGNLVATGALVFACGRWAGDLRAKHDALVQRVDRLEKHEDDAA